MKHNRLIPCSAIAIILASTSAHAMQSSPTTLSSPEPDEQTAIDIDFSQAPDLASSHVYLNVIVEPVSHKPHKRYVLSQFPVITPYTRSIATNGCMEVKYLDTITTIYPHNIFTGLFGRSFTHHFYRLIISLEPHYLFRHSRPTLILHTHTAQIPHRPFTIMIHQKGPINSTDSLKNIAKQLELYTVPEP